MHAHTHTLARACTHTKPTEGNPAAHKIQKGYYIYIYIYIYIYTSSLLENYFVLHVGKYRVEYFPKHTYVRSKTQSYMRFLHKYIVKK